MTDSKPLFGGETLGEAAYIAFFVACRAEMEAALAPVVEPMVRRWVHVFPIAQWDDKPDTVRHFPWDNIQAIANEAMRNAVRLARRLENAVKEKEVAK